MFVAVNQVSGGAAAQRVAEWAASAWPDAVLSVAHGWTIWTDGRFLQQPFVGPDSVAVVYGVIWRGHTSRGPGQAVSVANDLDAGAPLPHAWDGLFAFALPHNRRAHPPTTPRASLTVSPNPLRFPPPAPPSPSNFPPMRIPTF